LGWRGTAGVFGWAFNDPSSAGTAMECWQARKDGCGEKQVYNVGVSVVCSALENSNAEFQ